MTTTINPTANGRKRPSLGEQINRLDSMLDGLSEGLNDAVADAVKAAVGTAVKEAVQVVLTEVFSNPDVLKKLHAVMTPPVIDPQPRQMPKRPNESQRVEDVWQGVRTCIATIKEVSSAGAQKLRNTTGIAWERTVEKLKSLLSMCEVLAPFKYQILTALGIGATVGVASWFGGPSISAVASGVGGFVTTLAVQGGLWVRKMFRSSVEAFA